MAADVEGIENAIEASRVNYETVSESKKEMYENQVKELLED